MALKKSFVLSGKAHLSTLGKTVRLPDVESVETEPFYIKVLTVGGDKSRLCAVVGFFYDSDRAFAWKENYEFALALTGGNPIAQAYSHLKTLPEFAGATDC